MAADPALLLAWLSARSIARQLPPPILDRGGYRVDTGSEKEAKRWVFPALCEGLGIVARGISQPRHFVKLCAINDELSAALPEGWSLRPLSYFMTTTARLKTRSLPGGYNLKIAFDGEVRRVQVLAPDGELAASGYAAETAEAFVYDRVETMSGHRRKGLGSALMAALGSTRTKAVPELLTASEDGRALYTSLGWRVLSPYATAVIPDPL